MLLDLGGPVGLAALVAALVGDQRLARHRRGAAPDRRHRRARRRHARLRRDRGRRRACSTSPCSPRRSRPARRPVRGAAGHAARPACWPSRPTARCGRWLTARCAAGVLGRRGERYEVVSALAERLEESGGLEEQLPALASRGRRGVPGAVRAASRCSGPGGEGLVATHGTNRSATQSFPISYRGQRIGSIELPDGGIRGMLSRRDQALLVDVVRQAAIAVRSSLLARELQESREQLVLAREEDRRRIRRDLHDGLGPVLGGVAMRLDAAGNAVSTDPDDRPPARRPVPRRDHRGARRRAPAGPRPAPPGPRRPRAARRGRAAGRPDSRRRARGRGRGRRRGSGCPRRWRSRHTGSSRRR